MNPLNVKGFNYQPSYGTSGLDLWLSFDAKAISTELERGKRYFPRMNSIRFWLSWDAYKRNPGKFTDNFETALQIMVGLGLKVMPVLFNRWHTKSLDYGGIYIDHLLPGSRMHEPGLFDDYIQRIVGGHRGDDRILVWDLCNEPFFYSEDQWISQEARELVIKLELQWLESIHAACKRADPRCLTTVGVLKSSLERINHLSDILSFHHYPTAPIPEGPDNPLDPYVAFARRMGKPLIVSETCWGSYDDAERVRIIEVTLTELNKRGVGWMAYLLHNSGVADAHGEDEGAPSKAGNLSFINADGSLRRGHQVINDFF